MTHKLKTETFPQKIKHSGGVCFGPITPLFSFVTFHLKPNNLLINLFTINFAIRISNVGSSH